MPRIRIAQYGTQHGHAAGKLLALRANPRVELVGVCEPDPARRRALAQSDDAYRNVRWFDAAAALLGDATTGIRAAPRLGGGRIVGNDDWRRSYDD